MNSVHLKGIMSDKPVGRTAGKSYVCNFRIGVQNGTKDKPEWANVNCVVWGNKAESLAKAADKGDIIEVVGAIVTRSYDGKDGKKVFVTEVKVSALALTSKKKSDEEFEVE